MKTFDDIYKEFKESTNTPDDLINDYRPCYRDYDVPYIDNAIVIWLNNGHRIIYISKGE